MPKDHVTLCWIATERISAIERRELETRLSAPERERAQRFVFEQDKSDYIAAHALARTLLSQCTGQTPAVVEIRSGRFGKPELVPKGDVAPPAFNLSHSRGIALVALGLDVTLGVDVECLARPAPLEIAERYFAPEECVALQACRPCDRHIVFFTLWTLKEAYMKATGLGMNLSPERLGFSLEPIAPLFDPGFDGMLFWKFFSLRTGPDHMSALALGCREDRPLSVSTNEIDIDWLRSHSV
ncbi:4'-phosphopantetheinyl transferase family protein [Roseivivax sp. CAU 1753]